MARCLGDKSAEMAHPTLEPAHRSPEVRNVLNRPHVPGMFRPDLSLNLLTPYSHSRLHRTMFLAFSRKELGTDIVTVW